jgi:uncharacterized protein YuzB (UPF0349 family)
MNIYMSDLLEQALAIRPDVRYVTAESRYGTIGNLPQISLYAFFPDKCVSGETIEQLMANLRASLPEAA